MLRTLGLEADTMGVRRTNLAALSFSLLVCAGFGAIYPSGFLRAQAQQKNPAPAPAPAATAPRVQADLDQLMRGLLFNNANVIFFAQSNDPAAVTPERKASGATDPLAGVYGGWAAVENSALALSEIANLLNLPGRACSNGKTAPVTDPEWQKYVEGLRAAGLAAYQAAQTKNMDKMLDAADQVSTACLNCHDRYRQKPGGTRCV
jgi:hypothetical protein